MTSFGFAMTHGLKPRQMKLPALDSFFCYWRLVIVIGVV
jgi:hypothetical protein